ncbi:MAG: HpsJ family protein [Pleurocapsa sp.]
MLKYRLWRLRQSFQSSSEKTLESKRVSIAVEHQSTRIINAIGYVILFLILLEYGFLVASSQIFQPSWAYNTAGQLIEQVWGLLLGFLLIFYRRDQDLIKPKEFKLLSFLSWFVLIVGISYFLVTPVIIGNAFRLHRGGKAQIVSQADLQNSQVQQYSQQLKQATPEQLNILLQEYQDAGNSDIASAQQLKPKLIDEAKQKQAKVKKELTSKFNRQTMTLVKTTVKWSIGAIVSGMCFVFVWKCTEWTRVRY